MIRDSILYLILHCKNTANAVKHQIGEEKNIGDPWQLSPPGVCLGKFLQLSQQSLQGFLSEMSPKPPQERPEKSEKFTSTFQKMTTYITSSGKSALCDVTKGSSPCKYAAGLEKQGANYVIIFFSSANKIVLGRDLKTLVFLYFFLALYCFVVFVVFWQLL